jgi:branched-chain amino acid transport system ATP-binding protein
MLEVERLEVAYGEARALDDVSLVVGPGELVCVVGPNGAGKSTLINTLAGLLRVRSGGLRFDGEDLSVLAPHRFVRAGIAVVPEGRRLFGGLTVRENLELGSLLPAARSQRRASLEYVCSLFPALSARLDAPAGALSGGQQQMVAIGRALMAKPRLLLLDEPSLGLAPVIVTEMFNIIREIHQQGVACLLVEQNVVRALAVATRAYVLEEGRISMQGPSETLLADPHLRRAYLGVAIDGV